MNGRSNTSTAALTMQGAMRDRGGSEEGHSADATATATGAGCQNGDDNGVRET
jgi:hypothetical protein